MLTDGALFESKATAIPLDVPRGNALAPNIRRSKLLKGNYKLVQQSNIRFIARSRAAKQSIQSKKSSVSLRTIHTAEPILLFYRLFIGAQHMLVACKSGYKHDKALSGRRRWNVKSAKAQNRWQISAASSDLQKSILKLTEAGRLYCQQTDLKIVVHSPEKINGKEHAIIVIYFTHVGTIRVPLKKPNVFADAETPALRIATPGFPENVFTFLCPFPAGRSNCCLTADCRC